MLRLYGEGRSGKMPIERIEMRRPVCAHGHFRDDPRLTPIVVGHAAQAFAANWVEPNLTPPVTTGPMAREYEARLRRYFAASGRPDHQLVMIIYLTEHTDERLIEEAYALGIRVVKLYYKVTTNSEHGVTHWREADAGLAAMAAISQRYPHDPMFLQVHAEALGPEHHAREAACVEHMEELVATYPQLRVAIEHVSSRAMLEFVARHAQVGASITLHHLLCTWNDDCAHDGCLDGHRFCAPVVKTEDDREALLDAAFGRNSALRGKVWLGLDFAPHPLEFKDGDWSWPPKDGKLPRMGMYTLDVALPLLVELFHAYGDERDWFDALGAFTSADALAWYGLKLDNHETIELVYQPWTVPEYYADAEGVPLLRSFVAGRQMYWRTAATADVSA